MQTEISDGGSQIASWFEVDGSGATQIDLSGLQCLGKYCVRIARIDRRRFLAGKTEHRGLVVP